MIKTTATKTKNPVKKLRRAGLMQLADDLVHNAKKYNQNTFGEEDYDGTYVGAEACGTVCCLAGFCYAREIGFKKFNRIVKNATGGHELGDDAVKAARKQLKMAGHTKYPQIFNSVRNWPDDLLDEYYAAGYDSRDKELRRKRALVALKALSRLTPTGKIGKKVVHNLPQIEKLSRSIERAAKKAQR